MNPKTAGLREDLLRQKQFVQQAVPVYGHLLQLLSFELPKGLEERLEAAWSHRTFSTWYERPLLILAALRLSALQQGPTHPLFGALADGSPDETVVTQSALTASIDSSRESFWSAVRERTVQTNDVSRAVAWLWPAVLLYRSCPTVTLELYDIGASAGLNLVADQLALPWTDAEGRSLVDAPLPSIRARTGYDLSPLDVTKDEDRSWLRACIWPTQTERLKRFEAAVSAWQAAQGESHPPALVRTTATRIPSLLKKPESAAIAYQTIMRSYLSEEESLRYGAGMDRWLSESPGRAIWIELEADQSDAIPDRAVSLRSHVATRDGDAQNLVLAVCHPHPEKLYVDQDAVAAFSRLLA